MAALWESVKENLGTVLVTSVVSLATIFSNQLLGTIKAELNKAEQRPIKQETIAKDISTFIFAVENMIEFAAKNMTTKNELHFVVDPYNLSIETLRKNEYVYLAAIQRYWDRPVVHQYEIFLSNVRSVDVALHRFNEEYAAVEADTKEKADELKLKPLVEPATVATSKLQISAKELLIYLSQ